MTPPNMVLSIPSKWLIIEATIGVALILVIAIRNYLGDLSLILPMLVSTSIAGAIALRCRSRCLFFGSIIGGICGIWILGPFGEGYSQAWVEEVLMCAEFNTPSACIGAFFGGLLVLWFGCIARHWAD